MTACGFFKGNMVNYLATPGSNTTTYIKYYPGKKQLEIGFKTGNEYRSSRVTRNMGRLSQRRNGGSIRRIF